MQCALGADLLNNSNPERVSELLGKINRQPPGQLIKNAKGDINSISQLETLLSQALTERNRLAHSFYREHNFRRNSDEGRQIMLDDLESIHHTLLEAYKAVLLLSGIDLDFVVLEGLPTRHLPI
jgi:hypothetical protein